MEALKNLSDAIQGKSSPEMVTSHFASFAPLQDNPAERTLLSSLPGCLEWLDQLAPEDRHEIRTVLEKITRGQMLDLQRFDNPRQVRALSTAADLELYTYLVAGCVGEFWTRLCFRHLRDFAGLIPDQMLALGKRYGMGLQLINILRDAGADLRGGRCYFPENELGAVGISAEQILSQPERFQPVYQNWMQTAREHLDFGLQYSLAIRNRRVRAATALPALIGARTLALLRKGGARALHQTIKIPRREVRSMITSLAVHLGSRKSIQGMFARSNLSRPFVSAEGDW
jgi:farnesyl-diphosphate farnesyltransferase